MTRPARRDRDNQTEGYLEDQFGSDLQRSGIEFLHESKDWKPYGSDGFPWVQVLPKLDIYNDNSSRTVVLLDRGNLKFVAFRSQILILKPDVDTAEIPQITNLLDFRGDARIEQWIDFTSGGSSLTPPATVYRVPEIPASGRRIRPGAIGAAAQRPLRFKNKTYVVARARLEPGIDATIRSGARVDTASILAYLIAASGRITDTCYLEILFTAPP